jgi:hypothetical protein
MECHEAKKDAKIIDEIVTFVIKNGFDNINIDINRTSETSTITFKMRHTRRTEEMFTTIVDELNTHQEVEIEEFYWQLLGESDDEYNFSLLGTIVEDVRYYHEGDDSFLEFKRRRKMSC